MSIAINIYYSGVDGNAKKFADEMESSGTADAIRNEEGNLRYEYFFPANDNETVLLIDIWKNQAAIDIHHASPMMKKISNLREKYNLHMKVERFISDDAGISSEDKKFIRN
ncbi:MAG: antibiotic biosynthesis monooxygenase [Selenomonadaceae bacterium]|nr:antibiotic biosynthesis monooxygenase [Selenomonadaceae bacterium]